MNRILLTVVLDIELLRKNTTITVLLSVEVPLVFRLVTTAIYRSHKRVLGELFGWLSIPSIIFKLRSNER